MIFRAGLSKSSLYRTKQNPTEFRVSNVFKYFNTHTQTLWPGIIDCLKKYFTFAYIFFEKAVDPCVEKYFQMLIVDELFAWEENTFVKI